DPRRQRDACRSGAVDPHQAVARNSPDDAVAVNSEVTDAAHGNAGRVWLPALRCTRKSEDTVRSAHPDTRIGRRSDRHDEAKTRPRRNAVRDQTFAPFSRARPDIAVAIFKHGTNRVAREP